MVNPGVPLPDANERDAGAAAVAIALPVRAAAEASVRAIIDTLRVKLQEQCHKACCGSAVMTTNHHQISAAATPIAATQ